MAETPFSSRDLRDALSAFATGVTIVTASDESGKPVGMTASSFNSVSMDPPLILWSVTKSALSASVFRSAAHFAVHILASDQVDLSNRFAKTGEDKFAGTAYTNDDNHVPILEHCACRFDCSAWAEYEGGDHWIIVGQIEQITRSNTEALVFSGGAYSTANPLRNIRPTAASGQISHSLPIDGLLIYNLSRAYRQMAAHFHKAVRDSGLSVPEWRLLASLHGGACHNLPDLATRTFIDPESLSDMVTSMEENGLCIVTDSNGELEVAGTSAGHDRVEHLIKLGQKQDALALDGADDNALSDLIKLLHRVVLNTDDSIQKV
ncbi:hypothetical protein AB833_10300 [Chromatiales bacterium (ex Bugula neritina AB1)]|nr:hypothetical protein AB833_10300 [Chromatiales bacterium (ex Bugula neritina AB1)]